MKTPSRGRSGSPRSNQQSTGRPGDRNRAGGTRGRGPQSRFGDDDRRQDRGPRKFGDDRRSADSRPQRGSARQDDERQRRGSGRPGGDRRSTGSDGARPPRPARQRSVGVQIKGDLLYGRNAVRESLRADKRKPTRLFIAEGVREDERVSETIELAQRLEVLVELVPRMLLDDLTRGGNHQGVALETSEYEYVELEDVIDAEGTVLVMDHLNDPQNFGTLMRTADAAGIAGIVIPQDRSVSVTPAVVNASSGAVEHLMVAMTPNLARALDKIEESGRWIVGLDEDETGNNIFTTDVPTPVGLVLGAEGTGLSPIVRKRCQVILSLPMRGHVDSLNAATAGSIVLYDLLRRELTDA